MARTPHTTPLALVSVALALAVATVAMTSGCTDEQPVRASRGLLGTAIGLTVYGDASKARQATELAFREMRKVEAQLDPYDERSAISAVNRDPFNEHTLPPDAVVVLDAIDRMGISQQFSPTLWDITRMYDFGDEGSVPATAAVARSLAWAAGLHRDGDRVRFEQLPRFPLERTAPGFDFGGAAKGLALDRGAAALSAERAVDGALLSAGSSTLTFGRKPDGTPWTVGIEDPRDGSKVMTVIKVSRDDTFSVSTSGDYQTYFERGGVRYHHILDPATGRPARGTRSLTVFGTMPGMDSDVLSTALFVMGPTRALQFARYVGFGVYVIDAEGRATHYLPDGLAGVSLEPQPEQGR